MYEVTVPMSVTSNVSLPGHRIRLDISSSNFLHYDRNSNTGGVIWSEALEDMLVVDNTIHDGGTRPSRLVLPIVERWQASAPPPPVPVHRRPSARPARRS